MTTRSTAEQLDAAVDALLAGGRPAVDPASRPLLAVAGTLADALRPLPASTRFDAELARRLRGGRWPQRTADRASALARRAAERPRRLLAAGAVSSAAVGVTVTAYAMWRTSRRHPHRLVGR